jgi:phosphate transport system permease protein
MFGYLLFRGAPQLNGTFLLSRPDVRRGVYGILPGIINTLYMICITLLIACPVGIGAAVWLNEYAGSSRKLRPLTDVIGTAVGVLAGIPSILYGMFGAVFFGETLGLGYSILTGSLTLAIMVLPILIRTAQEALKTVPQPLREGALGCGAGNWQMIRTVVLPSALRGIGTGILLAAGRIMGESAALLFTAGAAEHLPRSWLTHPFSSGASLTVQLYFGVAGGKYLEESFGTALVLLLLDLALSLAAENIGKPKKGTNFHGRKHADPAAESLVRRQPCAEKYQL